MLYTLHLPQSPCFCDQIYRKNTANQRFEIKNLTVWFAAQVRLDLHGPTWAALFGLAKRFRDLTGNVYLAGLWEETLC
jgi:hypothetical protein